MYSLFANKLIRYYFLIVGILFLISMASTLYFYVAANKPFSLYNFGVYTILSTTFFFLLTLKNIKWHFDKIEYIILLVTLLITNALPLFNPDTYKYLYNVIFTIFAIAPLTFTVIFVIYSILNRITMQKQLVSKMVQGIKIFYLIYFVADLVKFLFTFSLPPSAADKTTLVILIALIVVLLAFFKGLFWLLFLPVKMLETFYDDTVRITQDNEIAERKIKRKANREND